jgi:hypothetical protein
MSVHREATAAVHEEQLRLLSAHKRVLWVGDSVIERLGWFAKLPLPAHVAMLAKGGDRMCHLLWRLEHTPTQPHVSLVIWHIGVNDISNFPHRSTPERNCAAVERSLMPMFETVLQELRRVAPHATLLYLPLYGFRDPNQHVRAIQAFNNGVQRFPGLSIVDAFWSTHRVFHTHASESESESEIERESERESEIPPTREEREAAFEDHVHITVAACARLYAGLCALSVQS